MAYKLIDVNTHLDIKGPFIIIDGPSSKQYLRVSDCKDFRVVKFIDRYECYKGSAWKSDNLYCDLKTRERPMSFMDICGKDDQKAAEEYIKKHNDGWNSYAVNLIDRTITCVYDFNRKIYIDTTVDSILLRRSEYLIHNSEDWDEAYKFEKDHFNSFMDKITCMSC